jgi:hypothetical protein
VAVGSSAGDAGFVPLISSMNKLLAAAASAARARPVIGWGDPKCEISVATGCAKGK